MKTMSRIVALAAALGLTAVAVAHGVSSPNCIYQCQNTTTGQFITRTESGLSEFSCCSGDGVSCPPGTVYYQTIGFGGTFCRGL